MNRYVLMYKGRIALTLPDIIAKDYKAACVVAMTLGLKFDDMAKKIGEIKE